VSNARHAGGERSGIGTQELFHVVCRPGPESFTCHAALDPADRPDLCIVWQQSSFASR
jgi:hypothetical protein